MSVSFYNFSIPIQYKSSFFKLDIDLNNKNIVKDFCIEGNSEKDSLEIVTTSFDQLMSSKKDIFKGLEGMIESSDKTDSKYILWLIHQKLFYSLNSHLLTESKPLLCRCFGLSHDQINEVIGSLKIIDMLTLTKETSAGAGCGTCVGDIIKEYDLIPRKFEELEENSKVSVLKEKKSLYQVNDTQICASELLLNYVIPLAQKEGIEVASLIDNHLYVSNLSKDNSKSSLVEFCQKSHLKLIAI